MSKIIGVCSQCGGHVMVGVNPKGESVPVPTCQSCGAVEDTRESLPEIKTRPVNESRRFLQD